MYRQGKLLIPKLRQFQEIWDEFTVSFPKGHPGADMFISPDPRRDFRYTVGFSYLKWISTIF